jgi:hypothetical protein
MKSSNSAGPYTASAWTFIFLSVAMFVLYVFSQMTRPGLSEEMQIREVQQRAQDRLNNSN